MYGPQVKREFFTQLPNKLIDSDISANAFKGYVRMLRDREIMNKEKFSGSIRKLSNKLRMPTMTVNRMVMEWEQADLIYKETQPKAGENRDEMVLYLLIDSLWIKNSEAYRKECTNLVQSSEETVPENDVVVPNPYTTVPNWYNFVPTVSTNEATNTISNTTVDTGNTSNLERETRTHSSEDAIASQTPSLSFSELLAETDAHLNALEHEFEDWLRISALSSQQENTRDIGGDAHAPLQSVASYSPDTHEPTNKQDEKRVEQTVLVEVPAPPRSTKKKAASPPLVMPDATWDWTPETMLCVFEAHQERRYPNGAKRKADRVRDVEFEACKTLYAMTDLWTTDAGRNIKGLLDMITHIETENENWWLDHNGHILPSQFVAKDRIHSTFDKLKKQRQKPSRGHLKVVPTPEQQERPEVLVSQEARNRNRERLRALAEADRQKVAR